MAQPARVVEVRRADDVRMGVNEFNKPKATSHSHPLPEGTKVTTADLLRAFNGLGKLVEPGPFWHKTRDFHFAVNTLLLNQAVAIAQEVRVPLPEVNQYQEMSLGQIGLPGVNISFGLYNQRGDVAIHINLVHFNVEVLSWNKLGDTTLNAVALERYLIMDRNGIYEVNFLDVLGNHVKILFAPQAGGLTISKAN